MWKLREFNRELLENVIKRTKLIDREIKRLTRYNKKLGDNEASREMVNRTYANYNSPIFFKVMG